MNAILDDYHSTSCPWPQVVNIPSCPCLSTNRIQSICSGFLVLPVPHASSPSGKPSHPRAGCMQWDGRTGGQVVLNVRCHSQETPSITSSPCQPWAWRDDPVLLRCVPREGGLASCRCLVSPSMSRLPQDIPPLRLQVVDYTCNRQYIPCVVTALCTTW